MIRLPIPHSPAPRGFTLIEITIALAITSIALVGLLGMLPQGIRTMKLASDLAIEARIHQQIIAELTQTDWDKRRQYHNAVRYYDDQGIPVTERQNNANEELYPIIYTLRILVPREGEPLPARFAQQGDSRSHFKPFDNSEVMQVSSTPTTEFDGVQLVLLEISTSANVRKSTDFDEPANERSIHVYRSTLTRATKL